MRIAPLVGDDLAATRAAVEQALDGCNLLLTVGGVSVGDHDVVKPALEQNGAALLFWKVAIKPGKPVALWQKGKRRVLSLPGNPASSLVTFALFGMPLLRAMQGDERVVAKTLRGRLTSPLKRKAGRLEFVRATLDIDDGELLVTPLTNQASGAVTSMGWSDAFAVIAAHVDAVAAGEMVEVFRVEDA